MVIRFSPLLLAQARYRLSPSLQKLYDPLDLVNDVWLVALARLKNLEIKDGHQTPVVLKFLSTTLLHHVNNLVRKVIRRRLDRQEGNFVDTDRNEQFDPVCVETKGIVTRAAHQEIGGLVSREIEALSSRDREVVILRGIEQYSNQQVAELLGQSANAVSLRYHRALTTLRERLKDSVFEEFFLENELETSGDDS